MENSSSEDAHLGDVNDAGVSNSIIEVGREFDYLESAHTFYKDFSKKNSFGIRIRTSRPTYRIYVSSNEGFHMSVNKEEVKNRTHTSSTRTGCKVMLNLLKPKNNDKWIITSFSNKHNHSMVSPTSSKLHKCHKNMSATAKSLVEIFKEERIPVGKVAIIFSKNNEHFSNRDCYNHTGKLRRKNLDVGDVQAVLSYFERK